jgi:uncharacterized protein (DUF433 family)
MTLPDFIASDDGFLQVTGHRIGLHHILRQYLEGASAEMIAAHYPTLGLSLIHRVIAFYLDNQAEVDAYMTAHDQEIQQQMSCARKPPSIVELRQRLERMRDAQVGAG